MTTVDDRSGASNHFRLGDYSSCRCPRDLELTTMLRELTVGPALPFSFECCHVRGGAFELTYFVPDRITGEPFRVVRAVPIPDDCNTREQLHRFVYDVLLGELQHELDEAWHVNGEMVRDPHRYESP
jgi:hypothetical protein